MGTDTGAEAGDAAKAGKGADTADGGQAERDAAAELRGLVVPAAETAARIVRGVPAGLLDAPTPCPEWDVRGLINHLIFWTGRGETAARKRPPRPGVEERHDFTRDGDWAARYAEQALATAEAWRDEAAWEGVTSLSGDPNGGMPAVVIGGMLFSECVLHGWDLAVATGQDPALPDRLVRASYEQVASIAEMGREYGAFGEQVEVDASAPTLDRLLGLAGRDPRWKP
ncbi:TIGR03086 family metal-binding protein [Actinomadura viridis]|uniref:TIGR03086 family metal-binding protein n=1 Tax=Actinomadura viridis TaxID=58110 RepID=UPI0036BB6F2D